MKALNKMKSLKFVLFSVLAVIMLATTAIAVVVYADWQDGTKTKSIAKGEFASFDIALVTASAPLYYSVNMKNSDNEIVKVWHDNTANNDGFVEETLQIIPSDYSNKGGIYTILISSSDGNGDKNYDIITLNVRNNAPVITAISAPSYILAGEALSVSFEASDADGDALTYRIYRNGNLISATDNDEWQTTEDDAGTYTYRFEASDGEDTVSETRTVEVRGLSDNHSPIITDIDVTDSITEGELLKVHFEAEDEDGDEIYYSILVNGILLSNTNDFEYQTRKGDAGSYEFELVASDGIGQDSVYTAVEIRAAGNNGTKGEETINFFNDFEISTYGNNIKIRNTKGEALNNMKITVTINEINAAETYNLNLGKNEVTYRPLNFELEEGKTYLVKIEISVGGLKDSGYLLIKK